LSGANETGGISAEVSVSANETSIGGKRKRGEEYSQEEEKQKSSQEYVECEIEDVGHEVILRERVDNPAQETTEKEGEVENAFVVQEDVSSDAEGATGIPFVASAEGARGPFAQEYTCRFAECRCEQAEEDKEEESDDSSSEELQPYAYTQQRKRLKTWGCNDNEESKFYEYSQEELKSLIYRDFAHLHRSVRRNFEGITPLSVRGEHSITGNVTLSSFVKIVETMLRG
jgi:hypothetical protein